MWFDKSSRAENKASRAEDKHQVLKTEHPAYDKGVSWPYHRLCHGLELTIAIETA